MKLLTAGVSGLAIFVTIAVAGSTAISPRGWLSSMRSTATDNAYVHADVTAVSPKVSGYIVESLLMDNQAVRAGDVLFRIDDRDYRERVNQAASIVAARAAAIANLERRIEQHQAVIAQATAAVRGAEAEDARAALDVERVRELTLQNFVSAARLDQSEADHLRYRAGVAQALAGVAAARQQLDVLRSQRPQLLAELKAAEAALELARIELEDTVVRSPIDGRAGKREARPGQFVRPGTLLAAIVPDAVWVVANFKETQVASIQAGASVSVSVDAVPNVLFSGRVDSLAPASGAQFALLPPDNATGNFTRIVQRIPVKIVLDPDQPKLDRLTPGMSARVVLHARPDAPDGRVRRHAAERP